MEEFKIELFEEENGNDSFPNFKSLDKESLQHIQKSIKLKLNLEGNVDMLQVIKKLAESQNILSPYNAKSESFSLIECFNELEVKTNESVWVNWYRFDEVDEFKLLDLDKYFDDIWFPDSDDIEIFDNSLDWVVSVRHDGQVFLWKSSADASL